jgi:uncharacterized protein with von Willebrand factor type A (vWA) domain
MTANFEDCSGLLELVGWMRSSGESAKVEITGELSKEQLDELLKMIQEKFTSPPEQTANGCAYQPLVRSRE